MIRSGVVFDRTTQGYVVGNVTRTSLGRVRSEGSGKAAEEGGVQPRLFLIVKVRNVGTDSQTEQFVIVFTGRGNKDTQVFIREEGHQRAITEYIPGLFKYPVPCRITLFLICYAHIFRVYLLITSITE